MYTKFFHPEIETATSALIAHLNNVADEPFTVESFYESEDHCLQLAMKLLQQLADSGKYQAGVLRSQLEKQYQVVKGKLQTHNVLVGSTQPEDLDPGAIMQTIQISDFDSNCHLEFLTNGLNECKPNGYQWRTGGESWEQV